MHTCISSHGLKRSWRSCPRRVNASNKNTPSTHHPRRRNVTTLMVGLKNGHIRKNLTQKVVNPRDIARERKKKKKRTHVNSKGKIPNPLLEAQRKIEPPVLHHVGQPATHTTHWAISAPHRPAYPKVLLSVLQSVSVLSDFLTDLFCCRCTTNQSK